MNQPLLPGFMLSWHYCIHMRPYAHGISALVSGFQNQRQKTQNYRISLGLGVYN
jgi:hypothetical protein